MDFKGISKEDLKQIIEFINEMDELDQIINPVIKKIVELIMKNTTEIKPMIDGIMNYVVDKDIEAYQKYKAAGINNPETIVSLILANKGQLAIIANNGVASKAK